MDHSIKHRLIKGDEEARDEKEESSKEKPSPKSSSVTATDKLCTETSKGDPKPKKATKVSVLVVEINKNTGKSVGSGEKTSDATAGAKPAAPTAAAATSSTPKAKAQRNPEPNGGATALLAQAAMQTSSLAVHSDSSGSGSPTDTPIPNVTPPTIPQEHPADGPHSPTLSYTPSARKRRGVPHTYRDYSKEPDCPSFVRKRAGGVTKPFPEKLHELLTNESDSLDVVGWLPHGRAFIVRKPKDFTESIMGKYFRQTKLTSFQRQLNLYGFRRITQGPDAGAYYHELFLKGRPQLCLRMQRQKVKGTGHKLPSDAETEPNFYTMPSSIITDTHGTIPPEAEESPGMQGLRGAANLLQGISAGLPPAALKSKSFAHQHPHGISMSYSTASTTNPRHWQYASAVARHESLVKQKAAQAKEKTVSAIQVKDEKDDRKKPPLDRSLGAQATDDKP